MVFHPPEIVRGLTKLDKSLFRKNVKIPCFESKFSCISKLTTVLKKYLLKIEKFKPIDYIGENVIIYLNPEKISSWENFDASEQTDLNNFMLKSNDLVFKDVTLTYDNFCYNSILKAILPIDKEGLSSFTKVGHILHLNLREHLLPFKYVIGEVLLNKIPGCKSVVNKIDMIDNTYRNFTMEVLSGDSDMKTRIKENGCIFEFDFSTVYWNSRLCTEHERIVNRIKPGDVVFDVFAGVGPFAIPAAKKGGIIFANDLNPESFKWLNHNISANKLNTCNIRTFNKDGRHFISKDIKELMPKYINKHNIHIIMNLPALAVEFLNAFVKLFDQTEISLTTSPTLYVYCFSKGENYKTIAQNLIFENIGYNINDKIEDVFRVRTVSSLKEMMRVSIKLDGDILFGVNLQEFSKRKCEEIPSECKKCKYGEEEAKK